MLHLKNRLPRQAFTQAHAMGNITRYRRAGAWLLGCLTPMDLLVPGHGRATAEICRSSPERLWRNPKLTRAR
jgi:hypothetical protein